MHSISARVNVVWAFGAMTLCLLACLNSLSTFHLYEQPEAVSAHITGIRQLSSQYVVYLSRKHPRIAVPADKATITFDLQGDFTKLFNWNTKLVYLAVMASFTSEDGNVHQTVIWDRLITSVDDAILDLHNEHDAYGLQSTSQDLRGRDVSLTVQWNMMPVVGSIYADSIGPFQQLEMPGQYF
eukprot:TRINITY_DN1463_c0_g1_i1.p1 TRINITY_DN1463_c0_g1~~TRINITY_DN1463_c0_g1_i1.p1  ORF type:complete len:214 (-),score=61.28 TRINITY_DN1463_c0_g1_i1:7-555(-)